MFDAAKLAEGKALTVRQKAGGEEPSELLSGACTESDSGETRVVPVRRLGPAPEPTITAANMRPGLMGHRTSRNTTWMRWTSRPASGCARGLNVSELHLMAVGYGLQRWARGGSRSRRDGRPGRRWCQGARHHLAHDPGHRQCNAQSRSAAGSGLAKSYQVANNPARPARSPPFRRRIDLRGISCLLVGGEAGDSIVPAAT